MFEENITREYSPLDLNTPIGTNVRPWFSIMRIAYIQQEAIKKIIKNIVQNHYKQGRTGSFIILLPLFLA